jgi:molecular chaperone DnaJ
VPNILGRWLFRGPRLARPGSDLLTDLEIELIEAALGTTRHIEVNRHEFCDECGGSGWRKGTFPPSCNDCGGRGQVVTVRCFLPVVSICPTCAGHGPPITDPCPNCQGSKRTSHVVGLAVDVPPGVESGMWLQIRNEGELGDLGAPRGNWRIHLLVKKHPIFDRRHNDLYCQLAVTDAAMTAGAEVQVPTLDGTCPLRIREAHCTATCSASEGAGCPTSVGAAEATSSLRSCAKHPNFERVRLRVHRSAAGFPSPLRPSRSRVPRSPCFRFELSSMLSMTQ